MRCDSCNKFASFDTDTEPEVDVRVDDDGAISGTVRIVNTCADCGQELKEATFDVDVDLSEAFAQHKKEYNETNAVEGDDHSLSLDFEPTRTDRMENKTRTGKLITNRRYMKHLYGAEGDIVVSCSCGEWTHTEPWKDEVQGSGMEELV